MDVQIEYVAQMRDAAGTAAETVAFGGPATVQDVVRDAARRHGGRLAQLLLDEHDALQPSAIVFVGDEQIEWDNVQPVSDGTRITVLAPLAGG